MSRTAIAAFVLYVVFAGPVRAQESASYQPRLARGNGYELLAIVLSAGYCADSQRTAFRTSIERMKLLLRHQAETRDYDFAVVGVALDWSAEDGLDHLARLGKFDQVVVGGGWTNLASSRVLRFRPKGEITTPQVLILERVVRRGPDTVEIRDEQLVHRVIGVDEIIRWVDQGVPLH